MLRGISTVNLWADDLPATRRYTELLGVEPYFTSEAAGRGPGYVEFRIGDYQHELGIIDRRFTPAGLAAGPSGTLVYWHVDAGRGAAQPLPPPGAAGATVGLPSCVAKQVTRPVRNRAAPARELQPA